MNTMHLIGADSVQRAGHEIASGAQKMRDAAHLIDSSLAAQRQWMEGWLERYRQITETGATQK
jgi:hypothetical protein